MVGAQFVRTFGAQVSNVGRVFGAVFLVFSVTGGLLLAQEPTGTQLLNGRRRTRRIVAGFGALATKAAKHR